MADSQFLAVDRKADTADALFVAGRCIYCLITADAHAVTQVGGGDFGSAGRIRRGARCYIFDSDRNGSRCALVAGGIEGVRGQCIVAISQLSGIPGKCEWCLGVGDGFFCH